MSVRIRNKGVGVLIKFILRRCMPLLLLSTLAIATGCQSIGGLDLNKALTNQLIPDSMEGSMHVTLRLEHTADADLETKEMIQALDEMQIIVDSFKQQDWETMSAIGKLVVQRGEIPFQISLSRTTMAMQLEGADVPIIIPIHAVTNPLSSAVGLDASSPLATNTLQEKSITESLVSLIINNLANPNDITVNNVTETVHGQSLSLFKIHSEIKGSEFIPLLKKSFRSLAMDDQGLKLFIAQLYDVMDANATEEDDNLLGLGLGFGLAGSADRELEIEFLYTSVKQGLLIVLMMLEEDSTQTEILPILTDEAYVQSDLYVDSALLVRKADFTLSVAPDISNLSDSDGLKSVQLEVHGEYWNHNKPVTADTLNYVEENALTVDMTSTNDRALLSILDSESVLYKLLKEDLHATRKTTEFYVVDDEYTSYPSALFRNGIIAVPARSLADGLGLELIWNGVTRELSLISPYDGTILVFKADSNQASVNGTNQTMPLATFIDHGQTYIPLRFVTDAIGAEIQWSHETQTATVTIE
jgi:hypothetical protein